MALLADIGGTKTQLALVDKQHNFIEKALFENAQFSSFEELLQQFLGNSATASSTTSSPSLLTTATKQRAVIAVAGPVKENRSCEMTNLNWTIQADQLANFGYEQAKIINDLEATAWGMTSPSIQRKLSYVQAKPLNFELPIAVLSVGTGLGEACILPGRPPRIQASEGGHKNLAPFNTTSAQLVQSHWQQHNQPYSLEKWFSGSGLSRLYQAMFPLNTDSKSNKDITNVALSDPESEEAQCLNLFSQGVFAEAGDAALQWLAWGGVIIAGGLTAKIQPFLQQADNIQYFHRKSEYSELLKQVPICLCFDEEVPLLGTLQYLAAESNWKQP